MMWRGGAAGLAAMACVLIGAASAHAGVLSSDTTGKYATFTYTGAATGEQLTVSRPSLNTVVVSGPAVTPGANCTAVPGGATCTAQLLYGTELKLGAGDDHVTIDPTFDDRWLDIYAGAGNDTISGPAEKMVGGPGNDTLIDTSSGIVELQGQAGDDRLQSGSGGGMLVGGLGADQLVGGPGPGMLLAGGDPGTRDRIDCGSDDDVLDIDQSDEPGEQGCGGAQPFETITSHFQVYSGGLLRPTQLRLKLKPAAAAVMKQVLAPTSSYGGYCSGNARNCANARLREASASDTAHDFKLVGGIKIPGTAYKGIRTGASLVVDEELDFDGISIERLIAYKARPGQQPTRSYSCYSKIAGQKKVATPCVLSS